MNMAVRSGGLQIDYIMPNGQGVGSLANMILSGKLNLNQLRTNETLRKDEWIAMDETLVEVGRQRLIGVGDLMSRGLRYGLNNAMGTTRLEWERVSDMTPASVDMSGLTESENDRVEFDLVGMPIPIIHKDFHINARALAASRNRGESLDTTQVAIAGRLVSEKIEDLLFNGGFSAGTTQGQIYGYTNAPNRNTGSVTATWVTTSGANILADILEMIGLANDDRMYGPFMIYVSNGAFINLMNDFKAEGSDTIFARLKQIPQILDIKPSDNLTGTTVVMVQMTRDVVDMVDGIQPTVIQWETKGGMQLNFKVMAILVPRVKPGSFETQSGIVHYS
jgi:uncharacterized linocin/CFP29 family protein